MAKNSVNNNPEWIGKRFGRLVVVGFEHKQRGNGDFAWYWVCLCDCGNKKVLFPNDIKNGRVRSCGCYQAECMATAGLTHGDSNTKLHNVWKSMKSRCENPYSKRNKRYAGRGITVCEQWKNDYVSFKTWAISNGYDENAKYHECCIDRIDNNKGYSPDNCRFVNNSENCRNKSNNLSITYKAKTQSLVEWCEELGLPYDPIYARIQEYGWSIPEALETPIKKRLSRKNVERQ